jgi:hypothetical protein
MARSQEVLTCPTNTWTELTNSDTASVTFQVLDGAVEVHATVGAVPPAATSRGFMYVNNGSGAREGEIGVLTASYAPGANRVYARGLSGRAAAVLVSHG